ncbi:MAG: hypothetical protein Q9202_007604, partial [Teloschistes flavicans]
IGRGLVATYLLRPSTTVIAAVRDPTDPFARSLYDLPTYNPSTPTSPPPPSPTSTSHPPTTPPTRLILIKIDALSETDPAAAIALLRTEHAIQTLDVVISNSGIAKYVGEVRGTPPAELRDHFDVNCVGHLVLFQAVWGMLGGTGGAGGEVNGEGVNGEGVKERRVEGSEGKFVILSSSVGSIGAMEKEPVAMVSYGCSKAATNFLARKIHFENEGLICFTIHPGWVDTDMGWDTAKKAYGLEQPPKDAVLDPSALKPLTVQESVDAMLEQIDGATKSKSSGTFMLYDGTTIPW